MLKEIELKILSDVYDMDINNKSEVHENNYELEEVEPRAKKQELAWYLLKLIRLGYLSADNIDNTFRKGGKINQKYNNNIISIWYKDIHITNKGIEYVNRIKGVLNNSKFISNIFLDDLEQILLSNIPGLDEEVIRNIKADASDVLDNHLIKHGVFEDLK